eukprot:3032594-Prymnesium_polylepis.1
MPMAAPPRSEDMLKTIDSIGLRKTSMAGASHTMAELFKQCAGTDGKIDQKQFADLYEALKMKATQEAAKERALQDELNTSRDNERLVSERFERSRKRLRAVSWFAAGLLATIALVVAANTGMVYYLLESTKEVHTRLVVSTPLNDALPVSTGAAAKSVRSTALVANDGSVVETVAAQSVLPLFVAPVLPPKQLASLEVVSISMYDYAVGDRITKLMRVTGKAPAKRQTSDRGDKACKTAALCSTPTPPTWSLPPQA